MNNPTSLGTHGKTSAIEVVFVGGNFQGLGLASGNLTVGPGIYDDPINGPSYGLGFTVTTSVFGGGGIGHIGEDSNRQNPGGAWTINQRASVAGVIDGKRESDIRPHDISLADPKIRNGSSQYTYWDHPGVRTGDVRNSYSGRYDFTITATNGRETSVLKFRVEISYGRGQPGSVRWGRIR